MRSRIPDQVLGLGLVDEDLAAARLENRRRLGLGAPGIVSSFASSAGSLLPGAIRSATFRSNFTPPVRWTPGNTASPAADATSDGGTGGLKALQPAVDLELATGQTLTIAPEGEPTGDYRVGVAIVAGALVAGVAGTFLAGYLVGRRRSGRRAR